MTFSMPQKQPPARIATSCLPDGLAGDASATIASVEHAARIRIELSSFVMPVVRATPRSGYAPAQSAHLPAHRQLRIAARHLMFSRVSGDVCSSAPMVKQTLCALVLVACHSHTGGMMGDDQQ